MDRVSIRVDLEDLIERLKEVEADEFATVELSVNISNYSDDYTLGIKAIDISEHDDVDYGELGCIPEDF